MLRKLILKISKFQIPRPKRLSTVVIVVAQMIIKFGMDIKLDVFYTVVTKKFVASLLLRNYDVITCILADA